MNDNNQQEAKLQVTPCGPGVVQIGGTTETAVATSALDLSTGVLTVHIGDPDAPPAAVVVGDMPDAVDTVADLYGVGAANAVAELADAESGLIEVPFEPEDPEVSSDATQLGVLRWLRYSSPLPLDTRLLRLEERLLTVKLADRLRDEEAVEELTEVCERVLERMHASAQVFRPVVDLLARCLEEIAQRTPVYSDKVEWALNQRASLNEWAVGDDPGAFVLDAIPQVRPELALAAGDGVYAGSSTVDWGEVPRGWTSYNEDNAMWQLQLSGDQAQIVVTVDGPAPVKWFGGEPAESGPAEHDAFGFQVFVGDWPLPFLWGAMRFDSSLNRWIGKGQEQGQMAQRLAEAIAEGQALRVRFRYFEPRRGGRRSVERAARWVSRGLSALRLLTAVDNPQLRNDAVGALEAAAEAWDRADLASEAAECRRIAAHARRGTWGTGVRLSVAERWLLSSQS